MQPENPQLALIRQKLDQQGAIDIPSVGYSMFPVIQTGDMCRFKPVDKGASGGLQPGDILLFADSSDRLIGHRLLRAAQFNGQEIYICKGDTNEFADDPVRRDRLLGILVSIERSNRRGQRKTIPAGGSVYRVWGTVIREVPSLSVWLRRIAAMSAAWNVRLAQKR